MCDTPNTLREENKNTLNVFFRRTTTTLTLLGFIKRFIYRPSEADETNRNPTPVTAVTIPYIRAPLKPSHGSYSPTTTLRHLLTNVKDRDKPNNREGAVYKMKCSECQTSYIDETGRNLNTRLTEHKRTTRNGDANNHIALHHQLTSHNFPVLNLRNELFSTTDSGKLAH